MRLRERFAAGPHAPGEARRALDALAGELPADVLEKVRLLVSELVTNSVRHAGLRPDEHVELGVRVGAAAVHVEVRDPGASAALGPRNRDGGRTGWGLYLVEQIADRWGAERSGGTVVWFEIDLRATRAPLA